jgi:hypothetical protein
MTQVYGVGHRDAEFDLDEIEEFYRDRAQNWELIVTPFASKKLLQAAIAAGYIPDHFETVLAQIAGQTTVSIPEGIEIEQVTGDTSEWMRVNEAGWLGLDELPEQIADISRLMGSPPGIRYMARVNGVPAAASGLSSLNGMFLFAGACTMPKYRGLGIQQAFTQQRLRDAGEGSFVQVVALPGSTSHRNLQRVGFSPLYSKLVLMRRP